MIDRIIISSDRRSATVVTDTKSYNLYHSEGRVMDLVYDFVLRPVILSEESDVVTEVIDTQLEFDFKNVG